MEEGDAKWFYRVSVSEIVEDNRVKCQNIITEIFS